MNPDQIALLNHIRALNEKTLEWVNAGEGRWATTFVEDLAHWAESGVHSVEDFTKYNLACEIYDGTKSAYGYRPNWRELMSLEVEDLEAVAKELRIEIARQNEMEKADLDYEREMAAHEEWLSASYEDRYLAFAEAAGASEY